MKSKQSHTDKKETPTKRLREPPRSAMNEMAENAQTSVSTLILVDAKVETKAKLVLAASPLKSGLIKPPVGSATVFLIIHFIIQTLSLSERLTQTL